ncbi:Ctr copper transporter [Saccharata proteae CBS 121410]|uniref:Copper transport protein n=1 Tax=Saccharata proteae CBS 121410 TaxID=1314787 RepID=A0A9P4HV47_9PEZI|nr:Ctr copper transporter [Saccharata proteae CBS 121410]
MDMGSGDCQISMLWNWYTIDACFLTSSWHISTRGQFAGSCIGVILLVIVLEGLRRLSKEYDRLILRQYQAAHFAMLNRNPSSSSSSSSSSNEAANDGTPNSKNAGATTKSRAFADSAAPPTRFRANVWQQMVRALLHMLQFACAYFIMLLAMYFNGYIIICIFIGAYIGSFIFSWESVEL